MTKTPVVSFLPLLVSPLLGQAVVYTLAHHLSPTTTTLPSLSGIPPLPPRQHLNTGTPVPTLTHQKYFPHRLQTNNEGNFLLNLNQCAFTQTGGEITTLGQGIARVEGHVGYHQRWNRSAGCFRFNAWGAWIQGVIQKDHAEWNANTFTVTHLFDCCAGIPHNGWCFGAAWCAVHLVCTLALFCWLWMSYTPTPSYHRKPVSYALHIRIAHD